MTIFPTRKAKYKTALSKDEVINRLEFNDFYLPNGDYELRKHNGYFVLMSVSRNNHPPKANTFRAKFIVNAEEKGSTIKLSFYPDEAQAYVHLTVLIILLIIQAVLIITAINNSFLSPAIFVPIITAPIYYLLQAISFSVLAITLEKQIAEAIEAEIHEITEEEMSKLQKWYEKERDPFKFRNK